MTQRNTVSPRVNAYAVFNRRTLRQVGDPVATRELARNIKRALPDSTEYAIAQMSFSGMVR